MHSPTLTYSFYVPESRAIVTQDFINGFFQVESDHERSSSIQTNSDCHQIIAKKCWVFITLKNTPLKLSDVERYVADQTLFDGLAYVHNFEQDKSYGPYREMDAVLIEYAHRLPTMVSRLTSGS